MEFAVYPWPYVKITKCHNPINGENGKKKELVSADGINCPLCHKHLCWIRDGEETKHFGCYCGNCGRDLRKPINTFEKINHWLKWFGDKELMTKYAIGYLIK